MSNKLLKAQKCLENIYNNKFIEKLKPQTFFIENSKSMVYNNFNK